MKYHYIPIGILIVAGFISAGVSFVTSLGENYGAQADLSTINKTVERSKALHESAEDMRQKVEDVKLEGTLEDLTVPYKLIRVLWGVAMLMLDSVGTVEGAASDISTGFSVVGIPVPDWVLPTVVSIFVIMVVSAILYAVFKWEWRT